MASLLMQYLPSLLSSSSSAAGEEGSGSGAPMVTQCLVPVIGLDGAGKSTLLRRLVSNEFSPAEPMSDQPCVRRLEHSETGCTLTLFDAPWLPRNLYKYLELCEAAHGVIVVIDSTDASRLLSSSTRISGIERSYAHVDERERDFPQSAEALLEVALRSARAEITPILLLINKQDLPDADPFADIISNLDLYQWTSEFASRRFLVCAVPCSACTGEGLSQGIDWLASQLARHPLLVDSVSSSAATVVSMPSPPQPLPCKAITPLNPQSSYSSTPSSVLRSLSGRSSPLPMPYDASPTPTLPHASCPSSSSAAHSLSATPRCDALRAYLGRGLCDESDFLREMWDSSYAYADHCDLLRLIYTILIRFGRQEGLPIVFALSKPHFVFVDRTTGQARHHDTVVYFWLTCCHFALQQMRDSLAKQDLGRYFKSDVGIVFFLQSHSYLVDEDHILQFYSREALQVVSAQQEMSIVLPDIQPLPSVLRAQNAIFTETPSSVVRKRLAESLKSPAMLTDRAFLQLCALRRLPSWGHENKLRLLYVSLVIHGRQRGGVDKVLHLLQSIERADFHLTFAYFWVQMITYHALTVFQQEGGLAGLSEECFGLLTSPQCDVSLRLDSQTVDTFDGVEQLRQKMVLSKALTFEDFLKRESTQPLLEQSLCLRYYSDALLNEQVASTTFVLPDKQPLPSFPGL